jgi:hypothetical protein
MKMQLFARGWLGAALEIEAFPPIAAPNRLKPPIRKSSRRLKCGERFIRQARRNQSTPPIYRPAAVTRLAAMYAERAAESKAEPLDPPTKTHRQP